MTVIVYDAEIKNIIPDKDQVPIAGAFKYCEGWGDYKGMGISVITAYVWGEGYRVFLEDNLSEFATLTLDPTNLFIGFNHDSFDRKLLAANGMTIEDHQAFDFMRACMKAAGATQVTGFGMDAMCDANFMPKKGVVSGKNVAVHWQMGHIGRVIDYCLSDTIKLKKLVEKALQGRLRHPANYRLLELDCSSFVHLVTP